MNIYFLLIRLAALLGNRKAKLLINGQKQVWTDLESLPKGQWVWFHVASVGEFEQARPIIEKMRAEQTPYKILLTFFSPSGYELRKNYNMVDKVLYLPFATKSNAKRFLDAVQPQKAIFIKYEFWPAYLKQLKQRQIPTYLVAAIFRKNQLFFKPWGLPYRNLLKCFTRLFVQDEQSMDLLVKYGIDSVEVAGDTRFDRVYAICQQAKNIAIVAEFAGKNNKVLVAGSTWPQDEALLQRYISERPDIKLILVPHEIDEEHMHSIFHLFEGRYLRFTEANTHNISMCQTMVVDTIGMLSSIYRYATVSYVGGGFGVGIHNTLEPAVYGLPVIFGPNHKRFREAVGLIDCGAARSINNYKEFEQTMDECFEHHAEIGLKAKEYVQSELGATEQVYKQIFE